MVIVQFITFILVIIALDLFNLKHREQINLVAIPRMKSINFIDFVPKYH